MSSSCCSCGGTSNARSGENGSGYPYGQDSGNVTEKHYGCYKVGILFSVVIILLLLLGCVPIFYLTHNNNLILLILLITLILIGIVTYAYFRWQHRRALQMRRSYEEQKMNLTRSNKRVAPNGLKQAKSDAIVPKLEIDSSKGVGQEQPRYSFI